MRNRLLVSAAILVAGLAMASAQNAPERNGARSPRSQSHYASSAAARKSEQPVRVQATGSKDRNPDGTGYGLEKPRPNVHAARRDNAPSGQTAMRASPKHNDASMLPRTLSGRGRRDGVAGDRALAQERVGSGRDRFFAQGGDHSEVSRGSTRRVRRPATDEFAPLDLARSPRHVPDQGMGSVGERKLGQARGQIGSTVGSTSGRKVSGKDRHRISATAHNSTHAQVRNHVRSQARGQTRVQARRTALRSEPRRSGEDDIRKVQAALNQQGFNVGDPDGKLGKRTKEALIAFQKRKGFQPTGKADRTTLNALLVGSAAPGDASSQQNPAQAPSEAPAQAPAQTSPVQTPPIQTPPIQEPDQAGPMPAPPDHAAPEGVPSQPGTTGRGEPLPPRTVLPPPIDGGTPPDGQQMPDSGATGRVPAGSPQEDYKEDMPGSGGDQR